MSRSAVQDDLFQLIRGGGASGSCAATDLRSAPHVADASPAASPGGQRDYIWCNPKMQVIGELLEKVAAWNVPVVLRGESGAGKEVLAREVHRLSPRSSKPFVKINCAALPSDLLESELFGYERGAFTGAVKAKPGKFEMADGGTIFLDEIGEMDQLLQAKLLQVLQDGEVHHLGGTEPIRVDARVLVATHRNLERAIENGSFREDLYYRLQVVDIWVPPLRDRRDEILPLARWFLKKHRRCDIAVPPLPPELEESLLRYSWPGNVRELEKTMRKYLVFANPADLVRELRRKSAQQTAVTAGEPAPDAIEQRQPEPLVLPQTADAAAKPAVSESDPSQLSSLLLALTACGHGVSPDPSPASDSFWEKQEYSWEADESSAGSRFAPSAPAQAVPPREAHYGFAYAAPIAAIASSGPARLTASKSSQEDEDRGDRRRKKPRRERCHCRGAAPVRLESQARGEAFAGRLQSLPLSHEEAQCRRNERRVTYDAESAEPDQQFQNPLRAARRAGAIVCVARRFLAAHPGRRLGAALATCGQHSGRGT